MKILIVLIFSLVLLGCSSRGINSDFHKRTPADVFRIAAIKIKSCYESIINRNSNNEIKFNFSTEVVINDLGYVTNVSIDKKIDEYLLNCTREAIFELRFPKPKLKGKMSFIQPFNLFPKKQ